ncbi:amidoligase family protein [Pontibacter sp. FD36]|uniref:amidoligase family protein n=1 Tax=Pontibacter sp. FD36 TaxID=2789860 RepID=UPI0018A966FA|nr:amidoligase family protein [Pontibacter sp. FD36]MBF8965029.1 amidoligase family protein [Pontibacter sp. FD36]
MVFKHPPILHNEKGTLRTVGFELEYTNVSIEDSAQLVQELYGGIIQKENRFRQKVTDTRLGDFTIEFDLTLLTEKRYKKVFETFNLRLEDVKIGNGTLEDEVEETLRNLVGKVFPNEIACPPIPCTELAEIEKLREALYQLHAEGTQSFLTNAFGTHINVEVPRQDVGTLLTYLRAFLLLYPWLLEEGRTDLARQISPFIAPYPIEYVTLVLNPGYAPDLDGFIIDYHTYNPDRNRPLDLYPLLAYLRGDLLMQFTRLGKVKARSAFHYRLPNSSIAQPDWTLAQEWNIWVRVEELASDPGMVEHLSKEYCYLKANTLLGFETKWIKRIRNGYPKI